MSPATSSATAAPRSVWYFAWAKCWYVDLRQLIEGDTAFSSQPWSLERSERILARNLSPCVDHGPRRLRQRYRRRRRAGPASHCMKRELDSNLSGHGVCHTNSATSLVKDMLCGKLHCQTDFDLIIFSDLFHTLHPPPPPNLCLPSYTPTRGIRNDPRCPRPATALESKWGQILILTSTDATSSRWHLYES